VTTLNKDIETAIASGNAIDWPVLRNRLHEAHSLSQSSGEKVEILQLFHNLMNHVEFTQISEANMLVFREIRIQDYRQLLIIEGVIGVNACVETLDIITKREIAAGRLSPDDDLRRITLDHLSAAHSTRAELEAIAVNGKRSIWSRIFGKL